MAARRALEWIGMFEGLAGLSIWNIRLVCMSVGVEVCAIRWCKCVIWEWFCVLYMSILKWAASLWKYFLLRHPQAHPLPPPFSPFLCYSMPFPIYTQSTYDRNEDFNIVVKYLKDCQFVAWNVQVASSLRSLATCSLITPTSAANGRCYFISNTPVSAVRTGFRKLDWNTGMA